MHEGDELGVNLCLNGANTVSGRYAKASIIRIATFRPLADISDVVKAGVAKTTAVKNSVGNTRALKMMAMSAAVSTPSEVTGMMASGIIATRSEVMRSVMAKTVVAVSQQLQRLQSWGL